jgi:hypothetical protein
MEMVASAPTQIALSEIGAWAARVEHIRFDVIPTNPRAITLAEAMRAETAVIPTDTC